MNNLVQWQAKCAGTLACLLLAMLTACSGGGDHAMAPNSTGGTSNPGSTLLPAGTELLYVGDDAGVIHGFGVDPGSGKLTPVAPVPLTNKAAGNVGLAADAGGKVLYATVAAISGPNVFSFIVDTATGALSPTGSGTLAVPPRKLAAIEANLYVIPDPAANTSQMFAFGINGTKASLAQLTPAVSLAAAPHDIVTASFGNNLPSWMGLTFDGTSGGEIQEIVRQPNAGATGLKQNAPGTSAGSNPQSIRTTPDGKFVIVTNQASDNIAVFSLDSTTGGLTQVPGSPFATGPQPGPLAIDPPSVASLTPPPGKFVFVGNIGGNSLSAYTITSTGTLTPAPGTPVALGGNAQPASIAVDPAGKLVYVSIANQQIAGFAVDPTTGALTALSGSPFTVGFTAGDMVFIP